MAPSAKCADVYVGYPVPGSFSYRVPEGMEVVSGTRVKVNFGGRNIIAFVHAVHDAPPPGVELKNVLSVVDDAPVFDDRLIDLARYVAEFYLGSVGEALATALPSGERSSSRFKNPFQREETPGTVLSQEQEEVYRRIAGDFNDGKLLHLLYGVTGSGKTEVYMELARMIMAAGGSVIYLVPEISLSAQIFRRLYNVFGDELTVYHSRLTPNQRLYNWIRFYRGEARIAVGTRSAVFLQAPRLGMIVVDEEHDGSYKEHSAPRYNARRVALHRSSTEGALLVMGSATPSVDTYYAAERGAFRLHKLTGRYGGSALPKIEIVGMEAGRTGDGLSAPLKLYSRKALDEGKQVILLLNRRGFAPVLLCRDCGAVEECPDCGISLNYHREGVMVCHYCGLKKPLPLKCGACGSEALIKLGSGTQRIESTVESTFRGVRVFRLDQDSARRRGAGPDMVEMMRTGEIDILLGTQMVAKGFDFQRVSLVGVVMADIGLNLPDFRASERIFSLLLQVSGRSGRRSEPGRVIIQTLNPDHYLFAFLKNHDYEGFYRHELEMRRLMNYPPFTRLARLLVRGKNEERVAETAGRLAEAIRATAPKEGSPVTVLGPSRAPLGKIAANYRHHIVLKSDSAGELRRVISGAREQAPQRDVYLEIDMDPFEML